MTRPRLLDLFCGAGGCSVGYHRAGFDVVGVDINPQPRYPFEFHQADALTYPLDGFDIVHASPPCQSETDLRHRTGVQHSDLLTPTLVRLQRLSVPWVVENVDSTHKLPGALMLCGAAFGLSANGRTLRRHRLFESNIHLMGQGCACSSRVVGFYGTGGAGQMTRGYKGSLAEARTAMGIDWMTRAELSQAIPPAMTEYIGEQLLDHLRAGAA